MSCDEPKSKAPSIVSDRPGDDPNEQCIILDVFWAYSDVHGCYVLAHVVMRPNGEMKVWYIKEG